MKSAKNHVPVICHDYRNFMCGTLAKITDQGCEFVCSHGHTIAVFPRKAKVMLNIQDETSKQNINVEARLTDVFRKSGNWVYRVRWNALPALPALKKSAA